MSMSLPRQNNPERDSMNWLQEQIRNAPAPELILHLGAGLCHELPLWQESGAGRIVLVEPNPELLPDLRRRAEGMEQVEIVEAAVAPEPGRGDLHLFNFPLLSSLRKPTALYQSLPGLQQVGRATVELLPIEPLLDQLDMDFEGENWLVIDTPGEEANILQALEKSGCLHRFSRIFLTAGTEALYRNAQPAAEIASHLESSGYRSVGALDQTDADWPCYHLRLDRMALECERLRAKLAEAEQARAEAEEQHQARIEKRENALAEQHSKADQLTGELKQAKTDWDKERQALEKKKTEEVDALKAQIKELEKQRDDLESARQKLAEQAEASAQALEQAKAEWDKERHGLETEAACLTEKLELESRKSQDLRQELTEKDGEIESARADLGLAIRLQTLREHDLKELQARYGEVLSIRNEQQELLTQLHQRLSRAAEYLQLQADSEEKKLPDELLEALTGKGESAR